MQPSEQNQYDFITNPQTKTTNPKTKKLMFIAGAGLVIVLALWFIAFLLSGNNTVNTSVVSAKQENIIKVAELGIKTASSAETKNLAATVHSVVSSQNQELKGTKSAKQSDELKAKTASEYKLIEDKLKSAEQSNSFDDEFTGQINKLLKDYQLSLRQVSGSKLITEFNSEVSIILTD